MTDRYPNSDSEPAPAEQADAASDYRAVSPLAVLGLILACLSSFALLSTSLVAIPMLGAVLSAAAWIRIARGEGRLVGRAAARFGLFVSLFFVALVAGNALTWNYWLAKTSTDVAWEWIDYLRDDHPEKAYQFAKYESERPSLADDAIWDYYRRYPVELEGLRRFVNTDGVHDLLVLRQDATVRHWETEEIVAYKDGIGVSHVFSITYGPPGSRTTFFCRLVMSRRNNPDTGKAEWRIAQHTAGVTPASKAS